jgi:hypothetical protein
MTWQASAKRNHPVSNPLIRQGLAGRRIPRCNIKKQAKDPAWRVLVSLLELRPSMASIERREAVAWRRLPQRP